MASNYEKLLGKLLDGHALETIRNWVNAFFVRKDGVRVLSDNNYGDEDRAKVDACLIDSDVSGDEAVDEMLEEVFGNKQPLADDDPDIGDDVDDPEGDIGDVF